MYALFMTIFLLLTKFPGASLRRIRIRFEDVGFSSRQHCFYGRSPRERVNRYHEPFRERRLVLGNYRVQLALVVHTLIMSHQAMRGAGGSFGIATTMYMRTHEQPPAATVFRYNWNLNVEQSVKALAAYQTFCQTNVSTALGIRHELRRGTKYGYMNHSITGTWFGNKNDFYAIINPLLKQLPSNHTSYVSNGTYMDSLVYFSDKGSLDTSIPDHPDTFYAKSLVVPEDTPMSVNALTDLSKTLTTEGFTSNTVSFRFCNPFLVL